MRIADKICRSLEDASRLSRGFRDRHQRVVLTHGCFDILHSAHVEYLERAASHGDVLFVGVNSDADVRRLKGKGRPVRTEEDRLLVVAALESVQSAVLFSNRLELIRAVRPQVYVASSTSRFRVSEDKERLQLLEEIGATVVETPEFNPLSSTELIERARSAEAAA